MPRKETVVISLGGSIIVPEEIDVRFLKDFCSMIRELSRSCTFVLVIGGGRTSRKYIDAAKRIGPTGGNSLDWLGIHATRLNARLVWTALQDIAHPNIERDPTRNPEIRKPVLIVGGWKPGFSSDFCAVKYALTHGAKRVINITDVDYVYDRDPNTSKNARPIKEMTWDSMKKIVGGRWQPGLHLPFDPIASRLAQKEGLDVYITGKSIANIKNIIRGKPFIGTLIRK